MVLVLLGIPGGDCALQVGLTPRAVRERGVQPKELQNPPLLGALYDFDGFPPRFVGPSERRLPHNPGFFSAKTPKMVIFEGEEKHLAKGPGGGGASRWHLPVGGDTIHMAAASPW